MLISYYTLLHVSPHINGHLNATTTYFSSQGVRCECIWRALTASKLQ